MVTDPRFDSQPTSADAPPREKSGCSSCLTGCGIAGVVALVLLLIAGLLVWRYWRDLFATGTTALLEQAVDATALPPEEKQQIMVQVDRLSDAIRGGRLSAEQSAVLMQRIVDSPLLMTLGISVVEKQYIDKSGLNDEEKAEARQTLNRFVRGVVDERIPKRSLNGALEHIADKEPNGNWRFREQVSDEDLREFLAAAKEAADQAEIPEETEAVDPSEELKRIIDAALPPQ